MPRCFEIHRFALALALGAMLILPGASRAQDSAEYGIKAAMIYNIARFVTWPADEDTIRGFAIGIVGNGEFLTAMQTLDGKTIGSCTIAVAAVEGLENLAAYRAVVVSGSAAGTASEILAKLKDTPVLTIGDFEGFVEGGGMIELRRVRNRMRFAADPDTARQSRLQLSSQLLKLAVASSRE